MVGGYIPARYSFDIRHLFIAQYTTSDSRFKLVVLLRKRKTEKFIRNAEEKKFSEFFFCPFILSFNSVYERNTQNTNNHDVYIMILLLLVFIDFYLFIIRFISRSWSLFFPQFQIMNVYYIESRENR